MAVSIHACPPFDVGPEPIDQWIQGLRKAGVRHAAPALILALERLRQTEIPAEARLGLLSVLKKPLLKTCAGLPKPLSARGSSHPERGLSLEQRLYRLMFQNLDQALHQLERSQFLLDEEAIQHQDWVMRNLFRFFDRQLRYATLWGTPMAEGSWRDLHELHAYLRVGLRPVAEEPAGTRPRPDHPDRVLDYKQLLLFGLAGAQCASWARSGVVTEGLRGWAQETVLKEPQAMQGEMALFLVEVCEDSAPRWKQGPLDRDFRGWVLVPPRDYTERLSKAVKGA